MEPWMVEKKEWVDLTHSLGDGIALYGDDPRTNLFKIKDIKEDGYTLYRLETCLHAGTHMDVPMHMLPSDKRIGDYAIDGFQGEGILLDVSREISPQGEIFMKESYRRMDLHNKILILKTGFFERFGTKEYFLDYPVIREELALFFIEQGIKILAVDTPAPDRFPFRIHHLLLKKDIPIIENVANLKKLTSGDSFYVFAFPLKIEAEASPLRLVIAI